MFYQALSAMVMGCHQSKTGKRAASVVIDACSSFFSRGISLNNTKGTLSFRDIAWRSFYIFLEYYRLR